MSTLQFQLFLKASSLLKFLLTLVCSMLLHLTLLLRLVSKMSITYCSGMIKSILFAKNSIITLSVNKLSELLQKMQQNTLIGWKNLGLKENIFSAEAMKIILMMITLSLMKTLRIVMIAKQKITCLFLKEDPYCFLKMLKRITTGIFLN